jgi:hypothetical protein
MKGTIPVTVNIKDSEGNLLGTSTNPKARNMSPVLKKATIKAKLHTEKQMGEISGIEANIIVFLKKS